jgi:murein DD-endopeptidase MepM/ murein hydrolase activator NlpD
LLGYVGNSGNTDEPHLHIHVQRPGPPSAPLSGEPRSVTFDGRFLVRNMVVDAAR